MTETQLLESLLQGGPVAVLAYLIFWSYRKDRKSSEDRQREDRIFMEDRLTKLLERDHDTHNKHTQVLTELVTLLHRLNGK